jgi:regulator of protease activity HflC (stomatin/prohibitin superfamily)
MEVNMANKNKIIRAASGWLMLPICIAMWAFTVFLFVRMISDESFGMGALMLVFLFLSILTTTGFFIINPNFAALLVLFGNYKGTVMRNGFHWANPFMKKHKISLRVRNQETSRLKVNDLLGNPIEIAAVVVWKVIDPFKAQFEVDAYTDYVSVQSESALRGLTGHYKYDGEDDEVTLRGTTDEVNERLREELQERLAEAGVKVLEARLSHLAYAAEIAGEMLRRQQATAVVAARFKIVEGAVGMVEHALEELNRKELVRLDEERKAAMVSNLLVVLCSESAATPVVNTGTLYQ